MAMNWYGNPYGNISPVYPQGQQVSYGGYAAAPQQSFAAQLQNSQGIIWVDGEVGAKAYQMPAGQSGPIALWDTNDTVIYLKSCNQMGMPNPLQRIHYTMEEPQNLLMNGQSGNSGNGASGNSSNEAELRNELNALRSEIQSLKESMNQQRFNQNGSRNGQQNGINGNKGGGQNG